MRSLAALILLNLGFAQAQTPAQLEVFEKNARPLFATKCQGCHNSKLKSGGLDLSSPDALKEAAELSGLPDRAEDA